MLNKSRKIEGLIEKLYFKQSTMNNTRSEIKIETIAQGINFPQKLYRVLNVRIFLTSTITYTSRLVALGEKFMVSQ